MARHASKNRKGPPSVADAVDIPRLEEEDLEKIAPQPGPQTIALAAPVTELLYGGARGGGKSYLMILDWHYQAEVWGEKARGIVFRRNYPQLEEFQKDAFRVLSKLGYEYRVGTRTFISPKGAQLKLRFLEKDEHAENYQGHAYSFVGFEELGNFPRKEPIDLIRGTLRSAEGVPVRMLGTANPGGPGHCIPFGDVLTPNGWIPIEKLRVGDEIYSVEVDGSMVVKKVGQVHQRNFDGMLWQAQARGLTITCTPEHRIAKANGQRGKTAGKKFTLVAAQDLPGQAYVLRTCRFEGKELDAFYLPFKRTTRKERLKQPKMVTGNDFCEFMGWFLSEGSVHYRKRDGIEEFRISIAQCKDKNREVIAALLTRMGIKFQTNASGFDFLSEQWYHYLKRFGKCRDKGIPTEIKQASFEQRLLFFRAAMKGDGHSTNDCKSGAYYTTSRRLAEDMSALMVSVGLAVFMKSRQRENRKGLSYEIYFKSNQTTELLTGQHIYDVGTSTKRAKSVSRIEYSGPVYDIGVPDTHTFIVRQNGSVWISGNSWIRKRYMQVPPLTVFNDPVTGHTVMFLPAKLEDNKVLMEQDPDYRNRLKGTGPSWLVRAWLEGDWSVAPEGNVFKREWFKYYKLPPTSFIRIVQSWDTGFKKNPENDRSVCTTWGVGALGYYLLDCWIGRVEFPELKRQAKALANKWCPHVIYVEDKASGQSLIQELKRDTTLPIKAVGVDNDKLARAFAVSPMVEGGNVLVPEDAPWLADFLEEMCAFPQGSHDDIVDSVSQGLSRLAYFSRSLESYQTNVVPINGSIYMR